MTPGAALERPGCARERGHVTSPFGLRSAVIASDVGSAHAVVAALDVGMVYINENN